MNSPRSLDALFGQLAEEHAAALDDFLPPRDGRAPAPPTPPELPGYDLLGELGRGGVGIVYKARQTALDRVVAVKVLATDRADPDERIRFLAEAQAAAAVKHRNVVQVFEYGEHDGRPYLVMEYLPGATLKNRLGDAGRPGDGPGSRTFAGLLARIARGVQAVHELGIVHRDLKPGNVLFDGQGEPKVADFGLAKRGVADLTRPGQVAGSLAYMAPEQADGGMKFVGPAADVWSLGVILYEALTGRRPFDGATAGETLTRVLRADPAPPGAAVPGIPRDLELICLKCLGNARAGRYPAAGALADDLDRFANGEPVSVRAAGWVERKVKWARRQPRWVAALGGGLAASLFAGTVASTALAAWGWREARRADAEAGAAGERRAGRRGGGPGRAGRDAQRDRDALEVTAYNLTIRDADREWHDGRADKALALLSRCPPHLRGWEWHFLKRRCGDDEALVGRHNSTVAAVAVTPDGTRVRSVGVDGLVREWDVATWREVGRPLAVGGSGRPTVALDRSGRLAAICPEPYDRITVWDLAERRPVCAAPWPAKHSPQLALSPDGDLLAAGDSGGLGLTVWDTRTGRALWESEADNQTDTGPAGRNFRTISSLSFSPDGRRVAAGTRDRVGVWEARSGARVWSGTGHLHSPGRELHGIPSVAFAGRDGGEVLSGGYVDPRVPERAELLVHDTRKAGGRPRVLADDLQRYAPLAVSRDGSRVAYGGGRHSVVVRDVGTGAEVLRFPATGAFVTLAFTPDGKHLLIGTDGGEVRRWGTEHEPAAEVIRAGDDTRVFGLAALEEGRTVIFAASGGDPGGQAVRLCVWDRQAGRVTGVLPAGANPGAGLDLAVSPDGNTVAAGLSDGTVGLWDWRRGEPAGVLTGHTRPVRRVAFTPAGRIVSGTVEDVRAWDATRPWRGTRIVPPPGPFGGPAVSPDGEVIAVGREGEDGGRVAIVRVETREVVRQFPTGTRKIDALAFSPDGHRLAVGTADPSAVQVWDWRAGERLAEAAGPHDSAVSFTLFAPDGRRVITGSHDGAVKVWDAGTCAELLTLRGHRAAVNRGAALANGLLFTSSWDGTVRVWDGRPAR